MPLRYVSPPGQAQRGLARTRNLHERNVLICWGRILEPPLHHEFHTIWLYPEITCFELARLNLN